MRVSAMESRSFKLESTCVRDLCGEALAGGVVGFCLCVAGICCLASSAGVTEFADIFCGSGAFFLLRPKYVDEVKTRWRWWFENTR
ncbi:hypothetical protein M3J09_001570 [Ascochyta lentis]